MSTMYYMKEPYTAYCCGITYDYDLAMTMVKVDPENTKDGMCSEECGYYKIRVVPLEYLTEDKRLFYKNDRDYIVYFKPEEPYKLYPDTELHESQNGELLPESELQDCYIARVELVEKLIETTY